MGPRPVDFPSRGTRAAAGCSGSSGLGARSADDGGRQRSEGRRFGGGPEGIPVGLDAAGCDHRRHCDGVAGATTQRTHRHGGGPRTTCPAASGRRTTQLSGCQDGRTIRHLDHAARHGYRPAGLVAVVATSIPNPGHRLPCSDSFGPGIPAGKRPPERFSAPAQLDDSRAAARARACRGRGCCGATTDGRAANGGISD